MNPLPQASVTVTVQFDEVDSYRVVHHSRLVAYLERARVRLFADCGFDLSRPDLAALVYSLQTRFVRPARLLDQLMVHCRIQEIQGFKVLLEERIEKDGQLVMKSHTQLVFTNTADNSVLPTSLVFPADWGCGR